MSHYNGLKEAWEEGRDLVRDHWGTHRRQCVRLAHRVEEAWDDALYQGERAAHKTRDMIQRKPLGVLGFSIVVGATLSALFNRRHD